jgi:hypothetical protein
MLAEREAKVAQLAAEVAARNANAAVLAREREKALAECDFHREALSAVHKSTSWRVSAPLRSTKLAALKVVRLHSEVRSKLSDRARTTWHKLPLRSKSKQLLKSAVCVSAYLPQYASLSRLEGISSLCPRVPRGQRTSYCDGRARRNAERRAIVCAAF